MALESSIGTFTAVNRRNLARSRASLRCFGIAKSQQTFVLATRDCGYLPDAFALCAPLKVLGKFVHSGLLEQIERCHSWLACFPLLEVFLSIWLLSGVLARSVGLSIEDVVRGHVMGRCHASYLHFRSTKTCGIVCVLPPVVM